MEDELKVVVGAALIAAFAVAVALFVRHLLPFVLVGGAVWLAYFLYTLYRDHPGTRARSARAKAQALYEEARALQKEHAFPDASTFRSGVWEELVERLGGAFLSYDLALRVFFVVAELYEAEGFAELPAPPAALTEIETARYSDRLSAQVRKISTPGVVELARDAVVDALFGFCASLPPLAFQSQEDALKSAEAGQLASRFSIRLLDTLPSVARSTEALAAPFYAVRLISIGLFDGLRNQLDRNLHEVSGIPYIPEQYNSPKLVLPSKSDKAAPEIIAGYLSHTPLAELFAADVPFDIPQATRFEHHWIVAGSGHGKSQTLQYLIAHDLERVKEGGASVVVIDSQGDLIKNIAGLKVFAKGEALHGRLCLIDPTDIEYPVALNLFDVGMERINRYSPLDRERLMNGVLELYDFVLGSLLSAELTAKQSVIFRYITRLMLHIPGATIHTFRELMEPKGYEKYLPHIAKLEGTARAFFETEFNSKQFEDTKRQVVRRLWGILENRTFERMFSHPKNKLDLFSEMNAGKVILINTAKELLKQNGTEIFGRFFIALIAQVAQERATLDKEKRTPTFVYIDECADYLDQNVSLILEQARKFNVGMILAHQYVGQLAPKLQESFAANTSIKFAGGVSDKDAKVLSHMLHTSPEFIDAQPKGHFAASVRNLTASAVSLGIPFGHLENMPRMTAEERDQVRADVRERYAVYWKDIAGLGAAQGVPDMVETPEGDPGTPVTPGPVDPTAPAEW